MGGSSAFCLKESLGENGVEEVISMGTDVVYMSTLAGLIVTALTAPMALGIVVVKDVAIGIAMNIESTLLIQHSNIERGSEFTGGSS